MQPPRFPSLCRPEDWGICDSSVPISRRQFPYQSALLHYIPKHRTQKPQVASAHGAPGPSAAPATLSAPAPAAVRLMRVCSQPRARLQVFLYGHGSLLLIVVPLPGGPVTVFDGRPSVRTLSCTRTLSASYLWGCGNGLFHFPLLSLYLVFTSLFLVS